MANFSYQPFDSVGQIGFLSGRGGNFGQSLKKLNGIRSLT